MTVLPNLEAANAEIARLQAALALANRPKAITMKVTSQRLNEKTGKMEGTTGAISIYGLGRFPITLYRGQMERLLDHTPTIRAFIAANAALLAVKA